jgi:hypothetical protein
MDACFRIQSILGGEFGSQFWLIGGVKERQESVKYAKGLLIA